MKGPEFLGIIELSNEGIVVFDGLNIKYVNLEMLEMFGYDEKEEIEGRSFLDLVEPGSRQLIEGISSFHVVETPESQGCEFTALRKDGSQFFAEMYLTITVFEGEIVLQGIIRDITEQFKTREALIKSEEKLRSIIASFDDMILLMDHEKTVFDCYLPGNGFRWKIRPSEILNKDILKILPEKVAPSLTAAFQQASQVGRSDKIDFQMMIFEKPVWFSARIARRNNPSGEPEGYTIIIRDIHEQKDAEESLKELNSVLEILVSERTAQLQAVNEKLKEDIRKREAVEADLRKSESRYRALTEQSNDGIFLLKENRITLFNSRFIELLQVDADKIQNTDFSIYDCIHPEDRDPVRDSIDRLKAEKLRNVDCQFRLKSFENISLEIEASFTRVLLGDVEVVQGVFRDVTERNELQRQLHHSQKMEAIGRLVGGVAHDFNNLLTVISGNTELALMALNEYDPVRKYIEEIPAVIRKATSLIRHLLAFGKHKPVETKPVSINESISSMERMLKRIIGEDVILSLSLEKGAGQVRANPTQIEQIIVNLVVNARDAMLKGGDLKLTTKLVQPGEELLRTHPEVVPRDYVCLAVSDSGYGISEENRLKIFEPFFTTKESSGGTGLGLSTVFGIVKQYNGYIFCDSEIDQGTTFTILLPRIKDEVSKEEHKKPSKEALQGNETILVVEDDLDVLNLTVRTLQLFGYHILEANGPGDALFLIERRDEPVDLILTDVIMPHMNGPEMIDKIREEWNDIKVVYMSGYIVQASELLGESMQKNCFIQKPFNPADLAGIVRRVLDGR